MQAIMRRHHVVSVIPVIMYKTPIHAPVLSVLFVCAVEHACNLGLHTHRTSSFCSCAYLIDDVLRAKALQRKGDLYDLHKTWSRFYARQCGFELSRAQLSLGSLIVLGMDCSCLPYGMSVQSNNICVSCDLLDSLAKGCSLSFARSQKTKSFLL